MRKELKGFGEFQVIQPARYADWRPRAEQVEDVGNAFAYSTQTCLNMHIIFTDLVCYKNVLTWYFGILVFFRNSMS
jgi:hypothetical protein